MTRNRVPYSGKMTDIAYPGTSPVDAEALHWVERVSSLVLTQHRDDLEAEHEAAWAVLVAAAVHYSQVSSISLDCIGADLAEGLESIVEQPVDNA